MRSFLIQIALSILLWGVVVYFWGIVYVLVVMLISFGVGLFYSLNSLDLHFVIGWREKAWDLLYALAAAVVVALFPITFFALVKSG